MEGKHILPPLPEDEAAELNAQTQLSDEALWTIAREQMPADQQERIRLFMGRTSKVALSEDEYQELENLVEQGQKRMLRKGKAAALLAERGYTITREKLRT